MVLGKLGITCKRMNLEHSLILHAKIKSKWIKDLNIRPDTIKLLEENIGRKLFDINYSKIFFQSTTCSNGNKNKNKDLVKLKSFCTAKGSLNKTKRQPSEWEINPLSTGSFANIFSHSEGCLFVLFMVPFAVQKFLSLIRSYLFCFNFHYYC